MVIIFSFCATTVYQSKARRRVSITPGVRRPVARCNASLINQKVEEGEVVGWVLKDEVPLKSL